MTPRAPGALAAALLVLTGCSSEVAGTAAPDGRGRPAGPPAASSPAAAPSAGTGTDRAGETTTAGPCTYTYDARGSSGVPVDAPSGSLPTTGTVSARMTTSAGTIGLTLDRSGDATCATASFVSLAQQGYFDDTTCHRLTTSPGLQVLQCGDPSGVGSGGPGYSYPTEVTGTETYPRGTVAMANAGQGTEGSQFFLVYGDSLEGNPNYTVFGTVDAPGLGVLDSIAAVGVSGGSSDGAPAVPVTISSVAAG